MSGRATIDLKVVRKKLRKLGFEEFKGAKHEKWKHPDGRIVMLSRGNQDVGPTLLKSICSQAIIDVHTFLKT
ncbi:MAG: hypothetical protein A2Y94_09350 [Caldithrix sp. RBG_13_44_9]|nr:MAG: hypothetical protein A2Y94_09350 [Caldithrix sp. RBG_13_44_9]